jgi:nucleotide-binding universal stress UspA family protein
VHSWTEQLGGTTFVSSPDFAAEREAMDVREHEMLAERMAGWQEKYPDVTIRRAVTMASPTAALLDHADDAQLVVVGSRGHGGFAGLVVGSTSRALIYHAPCPLLVVRPSPR